MRCRSPSKPRCRFAKLVSDRHRVRRSLTGQEAAAREQYSRRSSIAQAGRGIQRNTTFCLCADGPRRLAAAFCSAPFCEQEYRHALSAGRSIIIARMHVNATQLQVR